MDLHKLLIVALLLFVNIHGQQHIAVYDRIPLYVFPWGLDSNTTQNRIQSMWEMGADGVIAQEVRAALFNRLNTAGLRIIPYNTIPDSPYVNYIAKYTDASYTVWEAEGTDTEVGKVSLFHKNTIGETVNEGGITWVRTITGAGGDTLLKGPGYFQSPHYIIEPGNNTQRIREYEARYILKIDTNPLLSQDSISHLESENDTVVVLRVTYNPHPKSQLPITIDSLILRISDLKPYNTIKSKIISYDLEGLQQSITKTLSAVKENIDVSIAARYVEFRIEWKGLSYVRLWVDKVIVSDDRGRVLIESNSYNQGIRWQANDSLFAYPVDKYDTTIVGWYAVDEPSNIDNCEPLRYVDSLIKSATNGKKQLVVSLAGNFSGWFESDNPAPSESVNRMEELLKRSRVKSVMLNFYPYNLPWREKEPGYKSDNLIHLTECHLKVINKTDSLFWSSIQTGKWLYYDVLNNLAGPDKVPTVAQYLYQINLSLLYGSKGIILNNYYYGNSELVTSLYNINDDARHYLWYTTRDTISPRLKGIYGITLRNILQKSQIPGIDITTASGEINRENLKSISKDAVYDGEMSVDVGFFEGSGETKYFMLLNRYYSEYTGIRVRLMGLSGYNNWTVKEYRDTAYKYLTSSADTSLFADVIGKGDAKLYSVRPSVMVGGEINADETISGTVELNDELRVKNGATLTINGTYTCHKNILVDSGGKLKIIEGSTLNFYGGAKLIVNGRLTSKGDNSPITFNFGAIAADSANGIVLQESSYDTLINCKILNAHTGIKIDASAPYIDFCEITNSQNGMVLVDTYYDVENDTGTIIKEMQITNCATGIHMESSSAFLSENHTDSCIVGIRCVDGSFPIFGEWNQVGLNRITGEDTGIVAVKSGIILGMAGNPLFAGYNDCLSENILINASEESYVYGNYIWWGMEDSTFEKEKFVTDEGSYIDYDYYLNESATGYGENRFRVNQPKQKVLTKEAEERFKENNLTLREELREAIMHYLRGEGTEARSICRSIIQNNRDSVIALTALRLIANTINTPIIRDSVRTYLTQEGNSPANNIDFIVNSKVILAELDGTNFIESINAIIDRYPTTGEKDYLLYKKFSYYYFRENKRDSALSILSEMETAFPEGIYTKIAKELIEGNKLQKSQNESGTGNIKKIELVNYPNPFNPVTTIKYTVLSRGEVNLSIFNILGERLKEIVNETEDEGIYKVNVDMSRFSSGVYIYRIITPDYSLSKKMILIK